MIYKAMLTHGRQCLMSTTWVGIHKEANVMVISRESKQIDLQITGMKIEQAEDFKYVFGCYVK